MRLIIVFFLTILFLPNDILAQTADIQRSIIQSSISHQRKYQDKSGFDMRFYQISFDINLNKQVKADVLCEFMSTSPNLESIALNLSKQFKINRILGAGQNFERDGEKVTIKLRNKLKIGQVAWIKIFYESVEEMTSTKGNLKETPLKEFIMNPTNTFKDSPNWFPIKSNSTDKIDSVELNLTIPDLMIDDIPIIAVGNGKLVDIVLLSDKRLFKWKHQYPIAPNHVEFSISNYRTIQQSVDFKTERMKITHYIFPKDYFKYLEQVSDLPEMIQFFSKKLHQYPFSKDNLGILQIGANQFAKGQTNLPIRIQGKSQSDQLIYGLVKSWFGDYISAGSSNDQWLYKGFSLYAVALWNEHKSGSDGYQTIINSFKDYNDLILYSDKSNTSNNANFKSAYVFHMLRGVLGDKHFFEVLKSFTNKYQYGYANTEDFIAECKNVSDQKLDYFFNQWLYGESFPIYAYHFWKTDDKKVILQIIQKKRSSEPAFFVMPIDVKFNVNGKDTTVTVFNDKQSQNWEFKFHSSKIKDVILDPNNKLLKQVILKEQRLSSKGLVRDLKMQSEDDFNRYMTLSMRTYSRQWAIVELKTLDGKRVYYEELIVEDPFSETIKFPQSVRKGKYILSVSTDSSVFSREWTIKK
jgi:hypothetical protein